MRRSRSRIFAAFAQPAPVTTEADVAEAIWRAANDTSAAVALSRRRRCGGDCARGVTFATLNTAWAGAPAPADPPLRT